MQVRDKFARLENIPGGDRSARIAALNDALRRHRTGGRLFVTAGVMALGSNALPTILDAIGAFTAFTDDNDPYGEHGFGSLEHSRHRVFWKIDYYDRTLHAGSPDPADPRVTVRLLTVMLAEEY